jgi:hypothetical protein
MIRHYSLPIEGCGHRLPRTRFVVRYTTILATIQLRNLDRHYREKNNSHYTLSKTIHKQLYKLFSGDDKRQPSATRWRQLIDAKHDRIVGERVNAHRICFVHNIDVDFARRFAKANRHFDIKRRTPHIAVCQLHRIRVARNRR